MDNCCVAKLSDAIQEDLWSWALQKLGEETVYWIAGAVVVFFLIVILFEKITNILANVKNVCSVSLKDGGGETPENIPAPPAEEDIADKHEKLGELDCENQNLGEESNGKDGCAHTVALSIETQLVDRNVKKIKEQFSATKSDPKEILTLFSKLKDGLICANDAPSYEIAKEMIFGGKWDSLYGKMPEIYRCILRNLNSYSGAGRIYYEKCAEEAKSNGVSEQVVQDGIWDELSSEQQLPILLYGALNREFDLPRPSTLTKGKDGSFYSFVGGTPWAKHFDVATLLYLLFAENPNPIRDIVEKAHTSK